MNGLRNIFIKIGLKDTTTNNYLVDIEKSLYVIKIFVPNNKKLDVKNFEEYDKI